MLKFRDIYQRRCELFLDSEYMPEAAVHRLLYSHRDAAAVGLEVWSVPVDEPGDPLPPAFVDAIKQAYRPAQVGDTFGPSWSTHWFRVSVRIPGGADWRGRRVLLRWEAGCEAMVWSAGGVPLQGLSEQDRSEHVLTEAAEPGAETLLYIELACNAMFGNGPHLIGPPDAARTFRLATAEIAVRDEGVLRFLRDMHDVVDLARSLPRDSARAEEALHAANAAVNAFQAGGGVGAAQAPLDAFLQQPGAPGRFRISAIGHCHIDTAWLWRFRETRRKAARSWASQLRLLERFPAFHFACPQMLQLEWVRQDYPALFAQVRAAAAGGRFIPIGGAWVEMDGNMPSGESFVRQLLYGQRFMRAHFGTTSRVFWLPDSFGYHAQLPQIMALAGMPYFLTQKISWNNIDRFPHSSFHWEGLDGTRVLAHFPPADTYTSGAGVGDLRKTEAGCRDLGRTREAMLVFGHGDGGGGPTAAMLARLERLRDTDGLPRIRQEDPVAFFERLAQRPGLLAWRGELYLEFHRGALTSQAKSKFYNRRCEGLLREAELVATLLRVCRGPHAAGPAYPAAELEALWKQVLLNQFHDVLPGSSIEAVYHDTSRAYQDVELQASRIREQAMRALFGIGTPHSTAAADSTAASDSSAIVFLNTVPFARSDVVLVPFDPDPHSPQPGVLAVEGVPGLAMAHMDAVRCAAPPPVSVARLAGEFVLENAFCRVHVSDCGQITQMLDKRHARQVFSAPANALWLYDDQPNAWDAWDVEAFYRETGRCLDAAGTVEVGMQGPVLASLVRTVRISAASSLTQIISLSCLGAQVEFYCSIDWFEQHKLLRVLFPVNVAADQASYECPFGQVARPTHANTSWDAARFEACGHRYVDLSEPGYGVALLNDSKYGHSVHGSVMGMSLLRAPKSPDATADMSRHIVRWAVFPHKGTAEQACVVGEAYKFNSPLRWASAPRASYDPAWLGCPLLAFAGADADADPPLVIDTVKMAEDSAAVILRCYEPRGARGSARLQPHPLLQVSSLAVCDLLEADAPHLCALGGSEHAGWVVPYRPFQIITLRMDIAVRPSKPSLL